MEEWECPKCGFVYDRAESEECPHCAKYEWTKIYKNGFIYVRRVPVLGWDRVSSKDEFEVFVDAKDLGVFASKKAAFEVGTKHIDESLKV